MSMAPAAEPVEPAAERAVPPDDPRWTRLFGIVDETSLLRGRFTLTSGKESNYFFQLRQTTLHREGARLVGELIVGFMRDHAIRCVGGLELGAVPLVTAAACVGAEQGYPVEAFFVRKKAKEHGAQELVDGYVADGEEILAVDDVTTTGGSMIRALKGLAEERNCRVSWGFSVVDREQGAAEELARHGVKLVSVFTKSDFGV